MSRMVLFLFFAGLAKALQAQPSQQSLNVITRQFDLLNGRSLPAMELEMPDSSMFNTASLKNKTVYVDFWFTTCPPCIKELPFAKRLQQYFSNDTNIVFLNICVERSDRKQAWRNMVSCQQLKGIHAFYTLNKPQAVNLLRLMQVNNYPTYLLLNNMRVVGYNAPAPSHKGFVHWAIYQASKGMSLSDAYASISRRSAESTAYLRAHWPAIEGDQPNP